MMNAKTEYHFWTIIAAIIVLAVFAWLTAGYGLLVAVPVIILYVICSHYASYIFGE
jgi:type IV secretory pathway TrbD component